MNPCTRLCRPLPRLSATPPHTNPGVWILRADDRVRTGDLNLGKVPRYQLRYVRKADAIYRRNASAPKPSGFELLTAYPSSMSSTSHPPAGEALFWGDGLVAFGLEEVRHDLAALSEPGFWAVVATFEGEYTFARFAEVEPSPTPPGAPPWIPGALEWRSSISREAYLAAVEEIRSEIARGRVYQVNLCRVLSADIAPELDLLSLAVHLSAGNPAPFARYLRLPKLEIVSASPERFLSRDGSALLTTPIKGTAITANDLLEKDNDENVMIVDLMRNDLGSICTTGSVTVPRLLALEKHPGLVHLVSDVRGELRDGISWAEILQSTMPPGSVSGAPKSTAVQIIRELEPTPRGPYCGAIGWVHGQRGELAVGIRTFWSDGDRTQIKFGTGAGITWGSDPGGEWRETELKAARLIALASGNEVASLS